MNTIRRVSSLDCGRCSSSLDLSQICKLICCIHIRSYALIYIFLVKSILVYISDIYTIIAMLAWESRKARMIIRSRDISYAFTNVMANNYYSMKSYDHFCFFSQINNSKKKKDEFAFFVFFTFKGASKQLPYKSQYYIY